MSKADEWKNGQSTQVHRRRNKAMLQQRANIAKSRKLRGTETCGVIMAVGDAYVP